ncbi:MAG TPA: sigma-70 family RNA polymerase sigma factor [Anaerolineales bacterium]|nr:sigma-70 family RNA polymerase sigma factor [Anaerolineales bacterium]
MLYFQQLFGDTGVSSINWCTLPSVMKEILNLSDEKALALAAHGDQEAFGALYERYVGRIYNYIYYRTGNQHDAEDLTARVFFRAMRHIENYTDRGLPFSAWLYRIAHNLVANWHRDNSRRKEVPLEDMVWIHFDSEHPETTLLQNEEREGLLLVIRNLPADRQQLLILKFVEHLSNAEIGLVMGRTEGAVKSLYHRTLLSLRDGYLRVKQNGSPVNGELVN